jgi:hypothetical protein
MSAIGIDDFLVNDEETARKKHREICRLVDFLTFHTEIPQEFEDIRQEVSIPNVDTVAKAR